MRNSFVKEVAKDSVMVTNKDPKFAFHQSTLRGNRRLPRRLILELKQADKVAAVSEIGKEINRQIGNFGRQI